MAARTFGNNSLNCLTESQLNSLEAVGITKDDFVDIGCSAPELNTCGKDALEITSTYLPYDEKKGTYTSWGKISLPWKYESPESNEQWQISTFVDEFSYLEGEIIYVFEDRGYKISLYKATQNIPAPAGLFNQNFWSKICSVVTAEKIGLPSLKELEAKYNYYNDSNYLTSWSEFQNQWSFNPEDPDSDQWSKALLKKEYLYREGEVVLYYDGCSESTCLYEALSDIPLDSVKIPGSFPPPPYWRLMFCVDNNKKNTCGKKVTCKNPNYKLVPLSGRDSDLICVPVESNTGIRPNLV